MVCYVRANQNGAANVAQCNAVAVIFRAMGESERGKMNYFA